MYIFLKAGNCGVAVRNQLITLDLVVIKFFTRSNGTDYRVYTLDISMYYNIKMVNYSGVKIESSKIMVTPSVK